jgi:hypothetical protein
MVKITFIDEETIIFDNGDCITFGHEQDYCEWNYADFRQIDDIARGWKFDEEKLVFESVEGCGFRFGNLPNKMVFVPCYSEQNGYYSSDIDIYFNNETVLHFGCEECIY